MTNTDLIAAYLACWNELDPAVRRQLLEQHWAPQARYVDPLADVIGPEGLDAVIGAVQAQFPGLVFTPVGEVEQHHDVARFNWGLGPRDGEPLVIGFDVVRTDPSGRIESVIGFLDKVPG